MNGKVLIVTSLMLITACAYAAPPEKKITLLYGAGDIHKWESDFNDVFFPLSWEEKDFLIRLSVEHLSYDVLFPAGDKETAYRYMLTKEKYKPSDIVVAFRPNANHFFQAVRGRIFQSAKILRLFPGESLPKNYRNSR